MIWVFGIISNDYECKTGATLCEYTAMTRRQMGYDKVRLLRYADDDGGIPEYITDSVFMNRRVNERT